MGWACGRACRSFLRGQNVPLEAEILEERQRRREKALQLQTAIRQQLEERERRRRDERERRQREERLEEERVRKEQQEQRRRLEDEQRRAQEKEVGGKSPRNLDPAAEIKGNIFKISQNTFFNYRWF